MKPFTPIQEAIIRYLIAENEEIQEPNPLGPYLRAFTGGFLPTIHFTLCRRGTTKLILYVQEDRDEPVLPRCIALKQTLLEIADGIRYLIQEGYVHPLPKHCGEEPLPEEEQPGRWFGYEDFTLRERASLAFACSVHLIPRLKLYDYGEQQEQRKAPDGSQPNSQRSH